MNLLQKKFWRYLNIFLSNYYTYKGIGSGVLPHRNDTRDLPYQLLNTLFGHKAIQETFSFDTGWRFIQKPFFICVFASRVQLRSMQDGINYSVRWHVKNGRRLGYISGNGWSSLRGGNEVSYKVGYLPYEYMPDEIGNMTFEEYSAWTPNDDKLLAIAEKFKAPKYYNIKTKSQAVNALEHGYALFTAGKWYDGMNRPSAPLFLLEPKGKYFGGHAYGSCGYRGFGNDFETPQTFGYLYGDNGKAWIDDLFGKDQYAIYVEEHLPIETYLWYYDNKDVKSSSGSTVYRIQDGQKFYFPNEESFLSTGNTFANVKNINSNILDAIQDGGEFK